VTGDRLVGIAAYPLEHQALAAKAMLESEGIPCFLEDQNLVAMDSLMSAALGGVKLCVPVEAAAAARAALGRFAAPVADDPADDDDGMPRCPACGSRDVFSTRSGLGWFLLCLFLVPPAALFALPLLRRRRWDCVACRHTWRDVSGAASAPATPTPPPASPR
jgi:hypothetical protein